MGNQVTDGIGACGRPVAGEKDLNNPTRMQWKRKQKRKTYWRRGSGAPRPGTARTTEQVPAASSSSICKETARGEDPRLSPQQTTGKNNSKNMKRTTKENKIIGEGEIGHARPDAEGIERVPPASSSQNCGGENRVCTAKNATGAIAITNNLRGDPTMVSDGGSDSDDSYIPRTRALAKRGTKWTCRSSPDLTGNTAKTTERRRTTSSNH